MSVRSSFQLRFREITLALLTVSSVVALVAVGRSFDREVSITFLVWVLGVAASLFGVAFTIAAIVAFLDWETDQVEIRGALAILVMLVGSASAIGWVGVLATGFLIAGWTTARIGRNLQEREWRRTIADRRAFFARVRRSDARLDPDADRFLEISPATLSDREGERGGSATHRSGWESRKRGIERARAIDGNPWHLPPNEE